MRKDIQICCYWQVYQRIDHDMLGFCVIKTIVNIGAYVNGNILCHLPRRYNMKGCKTYLIIMIAWLCLPRIASADSAFRCGTQLVSIDDTRDEVIHNCGAPTSVDSWKEERILRDFRTIWNDDPRTESSEWNREPFLVKVQVKIELWTYNLVYYRLIRYLKFENGVLKEITTGGKGY